MQRGYILVRGLCLTALILCLTQVMSAGRGRDFVATYALSDITESNNTVHLTITVNLRNVSGVDVRGGGVVLLGSEASPSALGSFPAIKVIHNLQQVELSQSFSVSQHEYQLWLTGRDPALRFISEDADGGIRTDAIDLERSRQHEVPAAQ